MEFVPKDIAGVAAVIFLIHMTGVFVGHFLAKWNYKGTCVELKQGVNYEVMAFYQNFVIARSMDKSSHELVFLRIDDVLIKIPKTPVYMTLDSDHNIIFTQKL